MALRIRTIDAKMLAAIAEHRILTVTQVAACFHKSRPVIRRRLRDLQAAGWVQAVARDLGGGRGRPERCLGLTGGGVGVLRQRGLLPAEVPDEKVVADNLFGVRHQLLLNWFRIHLTQAERTLPRLRIRTLAQNSPFLPRSRNGRPVTADDGPVANASAKASFFPDAVFATTDLQTAKTCLFFLEVDCGTETLASPKRDRTDVRQKIVNYQSYFRSGRYKHYERVFEASLRGFRLLFLAGTHARCVALCKLTEAMKPSDFVWLTDADRLFADGASGEIWARGGDLRAPGQSILGRLACRCPLP